VRCTAALASPAHTAQNGAGLGQGVVRPVTADTSNAIAKPDGSPTSVLRTLVLCDLVDSTALVERLGDQRAADLFRKHDRLARALIRSHGGKEIDKTDGFLLIFERPIQAVAFALAYQRELAALGRQEQVDLAARIGVHVGDVVVWDNEIGDIERGAKPVEVEGLVKPVAARLMGLALPRQILLSGTAYDIAHRAQGELGEALARVRWRTHGRYRFKGVPDLVPVFEVGEDGFAPLRAPTWSGKAHREMPVWRRPVAIGIELFALLLLVALPAWYLTRPAPAIAFAQRDWVVLGDLKNLTGQPVFDESLQAAFRIGLEQSRYVNVVPELQVNAALQRMERDPAATTVDRATGSEIALREGARALVLPTIAEVGGRVRLTAEIIDPHTQASVYSDSVDGAGSESVLPGIDELLGKMRGRLGESMASIGETSTPLAEATTRDLDALKAYSIGLQAIAAGKGGEAATLFNQAISLDPAFAQAWLGLANIYYATGQKAKAREAVDHATRDPKRLSVRERLLAEGYAALFTTPAQMREKWSLFARLYPDDLAGAQNLALVLWQYDNDIAQATRQFRIVTNSQHPRRGYAWLFLGDIQVAQEAYAEARKSYLTARQVGTPQVYLDPVNLAIATREFDSVAAALANEPTNGFPYFEAEKQLRTSALHVVRGELAIAARANLESSRQRARLARLAIAIAAAEPDARTRLADFVDAERARLEVAGTSHDLGSHTHLALAAMLALRNGAADVAERALGALAGASANSGYHSLEQPWRIADCESRIVRDAAAAVSCLEALLDERAYYQTRVALVRAYRAAGKTAEALAGARWLADHRGRASAEYLAEFAGQVPNLLASDAALLDIAELERGAGRKDAAVAALDRLLAAWKPAEGDPPLLQRARRLRGELLQ
jgi:putative peptide modification system cyclase